MLDLHVHVLPGIDDGPRTLEDALALARALAEDGIEHIVATPHIYPGVFDNTANRIGEVFDEFQAAVSEAGIDLTMTWAAEVRICPEILEWIELRRLPMLNGSLVGPSTVLIELPDGQIPVGTDKLMGLMMDRGITPLVAHPERNKAVMEQHTRLDALRRMGCKFQLTAGSLLGDFGTRAQTTAQKLLEAGWADVIATDAHNRSSRRPRMKAAREWLAQQFDEALALRLTKTQPTEIAGVSSFAVQSGEQRLVFRDMPVMAPLETDNQWSVDLMLGPDLSAPRSDLDLESPPAPLAASGEHWSLIDFRIDAVLDDLKSVSLRADLPAKPDLVDKDRAAVSSAPPGSNEDWLLPEFLAAPSVAPPAPPRKAPVAQAETPAPASVSPPVTTEPIQVAIPVPVPTPRPAPERVPASEAATVAPRQRVEPLWEPVPTAKPAPVSAPLVTSAPIPVITDIVPVKLKETATAIPEPVALMQVPAPVAAAAMVSHPAPAPSQPPRGMRLSEVAPRGWQAGSPAEVIHQPSSTASRPSSMAKAGHQASSSAVTLSTQIVQASRQVLPERPQRATADGTRSGFRLSDLNPLPNRRR